MPRSRLYPRKPAYEIIQAENERKMTAMIRIAHLGSVLLSLVSVACIHGISLRQGPDYAVYESRGVTVYIASAFQRGGFIGMNSDADYQAFYEKTKCELGALLERGVLTGRMFFKALGDAHPEPAVANISPREAQDIDRILAADKGPLVKILYYQDISDQEEPMRRTYDLWITYYAWETGWGSFDHFLLEIECRTATAQTAPCEFSKRAHVIRLEYQGTEL